jgi:hypothetical protein
MYDYPPQFYLDTADTSGWGVIDLPADDTSTYTTIDTTLTDNFVVRGGIYGIDEDYIYYAYATYSSDDGTLAAAWLADYDGWLLGLYFGGASYYNFLANGTNESENWGACIGNYCAGIWLYVYDD